MGSPYEILGIEATADEDAVVDAYRQRVKETHPDQGGSARQFQAVQRAYERIQEGYDPDEQDSVEAESAEEEGEETDSHVEYLNYEILGDYGWSLEDDDLFEKASAADVDPEDYGEFVVRSDESLLEAAESHGLVWPFACRGGACSNCAVLLREGELPPPVNHILPPELIEKGVRLACSVTPATPRAKVVYNVKRLPGVNELLLPASRFEKAYPTD